jgi:hypothetical protein
MFSHSFWDSEADWLPPPLAHFYTFYGAIFYLLYFPVSGAIKILEAAYLQDV